MAVRRETEDRFRVDLAALRQGNLLQRLFRPGPVMVDPWLIAQAVLAVMRCCEVRGISGNRLVWNDYRIFLCRSDYERLRALRHRLSGDLAELLAGEIASAGSETVGDLLVRLLIDESDELRPGRAVVRVGFTPTEQTPVAQDPQEMTVRVGLTPASSGRAQAPRVAGAEATARVGEPTRDALLLRWPAGEQLIGAGNRLELGRPHRHPTGAFVSLTGASTRINKRQAWVEPHEGGVTIGRLPEANPVQVNGRLLQPGGRISIDQMPVEISLSSGELLLTLDRSP